MQYGTYFAEVNMWQFSEKCGRVSCMAGLVRTLQDW